MRSCWSVSPQSAVGTSLLPPLLLFHYHNLWSGGVDAGGPASRLLARSPFYSFSHSLAPALTHTYTRSLYLISPEQGLSSPYRANRINTVRRHRLATFVGVAAFYKIEFLTFKC